MLILRMDRAIIREGGIKEMSNEAMRWVDTFVRLTLLEYKKIIF